MKRLLLMGFIGFTAMMLCGCATRQYTVTAPPSGPTLAEVESMAKAQVSDSIIVSQIQNSSTRYQLTAEQIIELKNAGVSEAVINALINTASKAPPQTATVVREQYVYPGPYVYVDPWPVYWWGPGPYYHHRHWR